MDIAGMDDSGFAMSEVGPAAIGCMPPDIGVIPSGCSVVWKLYAHVVTRTAKMAIQTSEVLRTYLFITDNALEKYLFIEVLLL